MFSDIKLHKISESEQPKQSHSGVLAVASSLLCRGWLLSSLCVDAIKHFINKC